MRGNPKEGTGKGEWVVLQNGDLTGSGPRRARRKGSPANCICKPVPLGRSTGGMIYCTKHVSPWQAFGNSNCGD